MRLARFRKRYAERSIPFVLDTRRSYRRPPSGSVAIYGRWRAEVGLETFPRQRPRQESKLALRRLRAYGPDQAHGIPLRDFFGDALDEISARKQITISQTRYLEREVLEWFRRQA
jgi:hypothetical protein